MAVRHHDLCFGCGQSNVLGLHIEAESTVHGLAGRFVVRDAHTGGSAYAHTGIVTAALQEAMALLLQSRELNGRAEHVEFEVHGTVPSGSTVELRASVEDRDGRRVRLTSTASESGRTVAEATGEFVLSESSATG